MGTGNQCRAAVGGRDAVVVERHDESCIAFSAWANPGADECECGDGEERANGLHYLRHSTPHPSMSTISADTPCFAR
jgi:hypothetical protein